LQPRVAERIHEVVRHRLGRDIVTPHGSVDSEALEALEGLERPAGEPDRPRMPSPGRPGRQLT
jgi:hypothetical protein